MTEPSTRPGPASPPPPDSARGGFTVVEVLTVLVLIGILAAMAAPNLDARRSQVDGASLTVTSRLLTVQRTAVLEQHDVRVVFDVAGNVIRTHHDENNDGSVDAGERLRLEPLEDGVGFGLTGAPALDGFSGAVSFRTGSEGLPTLVFHRNGSASEEGVIHLTHLSNSDSEFTRAIRLERSTGLARCFTYRTGTWEEGC